MTTSEMSPADFAAINGNNDMGFGGNGAWWLIVLLLFWGRGGYGYGDQGGAANNYVLASDFATLQRQLSDGFGGVEKGIDTIRNGLCDGFYTEAQLVNGIGTQIMQGTNAIQSQLADCYCKTQTAIGDVKYANAMNTNTLSREVERGFCETNFNNQAAHTQTMQAIDKVGDRVIDWLSQREAQNLRDENFGLKLAASQAAQNNYLVNQLRPCPIPAYITCNPFAANYNNAGCGCSGTWG